MPYRNLEKGWWRAAVERAVEWTTPESLHARFKRLELPDSGLGYDPFGLEVSTARLALDAWYALYASYFRVRSVGVEHLPQRGGYLLVANHAAPFPVDALMVVMDVLMQGAPPRLVRTLAHPSLASAPYLNILLNRTGAVWATRHNMAALLRQGQPVLTFPEGARAMARRLGRQPRLLPFGTRAVELAVEHKIPIIPVGMVATGALSALDGLLPVRSGGGLGAELPDLTRITLAGLTPLPSAMHLRYGAPLDLADELAGAPPSPTWVRAMTDRLQSEVQLLVDGLGA